MSSSVVELMLEKLRIAVAIVHVGGHHHSRSPQYSWVMTSQNLRGQRTGKLLVTCDPAVLYEFIVAARDQGYIVEEADKENTVLVSLPL